MSAKALAMENNANSELRKKISIFIAVAAFLSSTLFVFGPYRSYLHNYTYMHVLFCHVFLYFIIAAVFFFIVMSTIALVTIKTLFYRRIISFMFILAVLVWLQGNFLVWNYGVFDGTAMDFDKNLKYGIIELVVWITLLATSFIYYIRVYKIARVASILLILTQVLCVGYEVRKLPHDPYWLRKGLDCQSKSFHRYSKDKNVVILVLDGFPSFIFQEIIEEDPSYGDIFDGFTFYRNALSGYPNTMASVPNMLTGQFYDNSQPFPEFVKDVFLNKSLPKILSENGYQVDVFETNISIIYSEVFSNSIPRRFSHDKRRYTLKTLAKITLFRHSPHFIKKHFVISSFEDPLIGSGGIRPLKNMKSIVGNLHVNEGKPLFKFYHLMAPHPPIVFNEELEHVKDFVKPDRENFVRYSRASLKLAKMFIDKLMGSGIYDNTLLFIVADHGYGLLMKNSKGSKIDARALPLILVKPFGERGKMKILDAPVALCDIPKTIITALDINEDVPGFSMLKLKETDIRQRRYFQYTYIGRREVMWPTGPMKEYIISGFSSSPESWSTNGKVFRPHRQVEKEASITVTSDKISINSPPDFVLKKHYTFFWEVSGAYPNWINFEFDPKPKKFKIYSLVAGRDTMSGMPKSWLLQGSNDGMQWDILDVRKNEVDWKKDEKRTYHITDTGRYRNYRLYFLEGNRLNHIRVYEIIFNK